MERVQAMEEVAATGVTGRNRSKHKKEIGLGWPTASGNLALTLLIDNPYNQDSSFSPVPIAKY